MTYCNLNKNSVCQFRYIHYSPVFPGVNRMRKASARRCLTLVGVLFRRNAEFALSIQAVGLIIANCNGLPIGARAGEPAPLSVAHYENDIAS